MEKQYNKTEADGDEFWELVMGVYKQARGTIHKKGKGTYYHHRRGGKDVKRKLEEGREQAPKSRKALLYVVLEKSTKKDLPPGGDWKTIRGAKVYMDKEGDIVAGAEGKLNSKKGSGKTAAPKKDTETTTQVPGGYRVVKVGEGRYKAFSEEGKNEIKELTNKTFKTKESAVQYVKDYKVNKKAKTKATQELAGRRADEQKKQVKKMTDRGASKKEAHEVIDSLKDVDKKLAKREAKEQEEAQAKKEFTPKSKKKTPTTGPDGLTAEQSRKVQYEMDNIMDKWAETGDYPTDRNGDELEYGKQMEVAKKEAVKKLGFGKSSKQKGPSPDQLQDIEFEMDKIMDKWAETGDYPTDKHGDELDYEDQQEVARKQAKKKLGFS